MQCWYICSIHRCFLFNVKASGWVEWDLDRFLNLVSHACTHRRFPICDLRLARSMRTIAKAPTHAHTLSPVFCYVVAGLWGRQLQSRRRAPGDRSVHRCHIANCRGTRKTLKTDDLTRSSSSKGDRSFGLHEITNHAYHTLFTLPDTEVVGAACTRSTLGNSATWRILRCAPDLRLQ